MTVAEYLAHAGLTAGKFAAQLGIPRMLVYRWAQGAMPRGPHVRRVIEGSDGKITLEDLERAAAERRVAGNAEPDPETADDGTADPVESAPAEEPSAA